jgi:hypothetical protein
MIGPQSSFAFSRVLVAVGAAMPGHAAVETGVDLAAAVGAALEGLFVESLDLVRVSALPNARETSPLTGTRRALGTGDVERAFRVEAARLERLLATQAARTRIAWSFTVARGELWAMALARNAELIVLEARATATTIPGTPRARGPLTTVFDTTSPAWRALAATTRLARTTGSELVILVPAGNAASARSARKEAEEWIGAGEAAGVALPIRLEHRSVMAAARAHRSVVLVLPVSVASRWSVDVSALATDAPCPLVIAR